MKFVPSFKWAEDTDYSGVPATGPTKIVPPNGFTSNGIVPAQRFAAQWENFVRNATGRALQELSLQQLCDWQTDDPQAVASGVYANGSVANYYNPFVKSHYAIASSAGNTSLRSAVWGARGELLRNQALGDVADGNLPLNPARGGFIVGSTINTSFGIISITGAQTNLAAHFRQWTAVAGDSQGYGMPSLMTPSGTSSSYIAWGNWAACNAGGLSPNMVCGGVVAGAPGLIFVSPSAMSTTLIGGVNAIAGTRLLITDNIPVADKIGFAGDAANLVIIKGFGGGSGGSSVYNGTNFLGGTILNAASWGLSRGSGTVTNGDCHIISVSSTAAWSSFAVNRHQSKVWYCPSVANGTVASSVNWTLQKTIVGLTIMHNQDLGYGNWVAVAARDGGQRASADALTYSLVGSNDYGQSWYVLADLYRTQGNNGTSPWETDFWNFHFSRTLELTGVTADPYRIDSLMLAYTPPGLATRRITMRMPAFSAPRFA